MRPLALVLVLSSPLLLGGCALPIGVAIASYATDGALYLTTGKSGSDHLISMVSDKDCATWRVVKGKEICVDRPPGENPYQVDRDAPHRTVDESGIAQLYAPSSQGGALLLDAQAREAMAPRKPPGTSTAAPAAVETAALPAPAEVGSRPAAATPVAEARSQPAMASAPTRATAPKAAAAKPREPAVAAARRPPAVAGKPSTAPPAAVAAKPSPAKPTQTARAAPRKPPVSPAVVTVSQRPAGTRVATSRAEPPLILY
ncbi:MAG: hypothetical protein IPK81_01325 [Rhodospirillales bacterium]|nr:MAG: hypothetical protein IPK81_01325 [Rhodospirillales bacterium]